MLSYPYFPSFLLPSCLKQILLLCVHTYENLGPSATLKASTVPFLLLLHGSPLAFLILLWFFFILGARRLPASCRKCQQDVFCHHRPVKDQQHVPLQPRLLPSPLPKSSPGQEGDRIRIATLILLPFSSITPGVANKIVPNILLFTQTRQHYHTLLQLD